MNPPRSAYWFILKRIFPFRKKCNTLFCVKIFVLSTLCLAAALAPLTLEFRGGPPLRLWARYLWFRQNMTPVLRRILGSSALFKTLALYAPVFRRPLKLDRFRLRLAFSTGDAAETAVLHGGLCLLLNCLFPLWTPPGSRRRPEISLEPCFLSRQKAVLDCDISLAIPAAVFFFRMISASIREWSFAGTRRRIREKRSPHV
jgi:hypothetical protein